MERRERSRLMVLEGGLGAGKTTVKEGLARELGEEWRFYREPGGTEFGEKIRDAVQDNHGYEVTPLGAFLAYSAARANLIAQEVLPILNEGGKVILDRFWYSSYAYQGGGEGVDKELIVALSARVVRGLEPDLILHFDLDPEKGMERKVGCDDADRYDLKKRSFHEKCREAYFELAERYPDRWRTIDASQTPDKVLQDSLEVMEEFGLWR